MALALALAAALAGASAGRAQTPQPVVVELYTSQGCSSCPPADALLQELAARDDVIALALHVDYWDYIGWKDSFARPLFTQRQKGYARAAGHRTIYTPQMVIAGEDHVVGYRPMELADLIEAHQGRPAAAAIRLSRTGTELTVDIAPAPGLGGPAVVQLVRYEPAQSVEIGTGENAGRTIAYANVVTEWTRLAEWDGRAALHLTAPAPGPAPLAVILQRQNFGPILAAAALR
jgi:hypothetical protein